MSWHWDVIPRNFKYFMVGRTPLEALPYWGLVIAAALVRLLAAWHRRRTVVGGG